MVGTPQLVLYLKSVILAQVSFCFSGDKEIQHRFILVGLPYEHGLSDTASAGHDRKLGVLPRLSAYLLQGGYFLFSVKKSHILAYFKIYIPKRLFPKQQFLNCKR